MAFNSPDIASIKKTKEQLETKIIELQEIGLPGVKDIPKTLWNNLIEPKLLTERQITKKIIILNGETFDTPISEEDAQLIVYGKIYKKGGKLFDDDKADPSCVAKPSDEDYLQPLNLKHPIVDEIKLKIKNLKNDLIQLGIKLAEFLSAIPATIINIATSLIALVSSAVVLPFGAGLPAAINAVQTMLAAIKELQAKTQALLPLIGVVDTIALVLPKKAQVVIAQVNVIYGILLGVITALSTILGLLGKVTGILGKQKKKSENQKMKSKSSANPVNIRKGEESEISAETTGGDWDYKYLWTNENGDVVSTEQSVAVKPMSTTTYYCQIKDGKGKTKNVSTRVNVRN